MQVALIVSAFVASVAASDVCTRAFGECGGNHNDCCEGSTCVVKEDGFAQCLPTSHTRDAESRQCSTNWSQCNGQNWPHGVCCQDPTFQCNYKNQYLSLCEPKPKKDAEQSCTNVSVVGDATYCVKGPICGDNGDACPKKGDVAVADCLKTLNSYVDAAKCVAPADATCQKIPSGARGCVFGAVSSTKAPATTGATTTTTTAAPSNNKQCSTNWSQCNGQNWPHGVCCQDPNFQCNYKNQYLSLCEPKQNKDAEQSCTNVSVVGDATYCVKGPICGDNGDACPKKGDVAVADCLKTLNSYVDAAKCVAPVDATCQKIPSGARGCVFGAVSTTKAPVTTTGAPATTGAATTTAAPTTTAAASNTTAAPGNNKQCSTNWSQCNGQNWPYGVCCQDPNFQCNRKNEYLSLCEPKQNKDAEVAEVAVWQQCGGNGYKGDTSCTTGNKCVKINDWYFQCQPDKDLPGLPTWSQCFSDKWNKEDQCRAGDKCAKYNAYYGQCVPK